MLFNPTILDAVMSAASFVAAEAAPTGRIQTDLNLPNVCLLGVVRDSVVAKGPLICIELFSQAP